MTSPTSRSTPPSPRRLRAHLLLANTLFFALAFAAVHIAMSQNNADADPIDSPQLALNFAPRSLGSASASIANCGLCHQTDPMFSHPVKVLPTMAMPTDWPLAPGGQISCMTCHDTNAQRHANAHVKHDPLLRGSVKGAAFCTQCHQPDSLGESTRHGGMPIRSHLRWPGKPERQLSLHGQFDPETRTCLSCHDAAFASDRTMATSAFTNMEASHPVGVRYTSNNPFAKSRSDMPLQLESALDSRIRLFDHQVGCNSCHSPYSKNPALLVIANDRSQLCLTCHTER